MLELAVIIPFLSGFGLGGLCTLLYGQRKISGILRIKDLYEERASHIPLLQETLARKEEELRIQGERNAELRTALQRAEIETKEKLSLLNDLQGYWEDKFKAISTDALSLSNKAFLELAKTTFEKLQDESKTDLTQRHEAIFALVKPMTESLQNVDKKIEELEKSRMGAYSVLKHQVNELITSQKELASETTNLVHALKTPSVRGRWGEIQLKRVVEMAGMIAYCDFEEQVYRADEDVKLRPDLVINLPGGRKVIVDAKAPLSAYLEALEAKTDEKRLIKLKEHAAQVKNHIRSLSKRSYYEQFESTPDFIILFLPGEIFFSAALEHDPSLIEMGVEERIILATPTTLIALLRTISYGWRQESLAKNAQEISLLGKELHKRLCDMADHFGRLGRNLGSAVQSYNQAMGSFEHRVLASARKFKELGTVSDGNEITPLEPLSHIPRELQSPGTKKVG